MYDRPPKNNVCMPAVCIIGHKTRKQSLIGHKTRKQSLIGHKKTISHRPQENNLYFADSGCIYVGSCACVCVHARLCCVGDEKNVHGAYSNFETLC